jgi:hypothetical protein
MTTASRSFRRQVAKKKGPIERPHVEFTLDWVDENDEVVKTTTFHSTMPSDENLFLLAAMAGDEDATAAEEAAGIMALFKSSLPEDEYRILRQRLKDPEDDVTLEVLQEVIPWLMEEWTAFPTQPASASSASPVTTGARSTGRVRGQGSTRSTST